MKTKNINRTIFNNGDTSDIINVVMMAYDIENDPQIEELARKLQGQNYTETGKNIWQYLIDNVNYRADVGMQEIKSPARLISDRAGDCKSYSLFTAVVLRWLNIPAIFRFVSYDKRKEATHVYVVIDPEGENIIVDAVAYVQASQPFNNEIKYTYHCDMSDKGTRIAYLAGLPKARKAQQIGSVVDDPERYKVWIGDENERSVTPGKHYLYSLFDLTLETLNIQTTDKDIAAYFDQLDIIASFLHGYNHVNGDTEQFKNIAFVICCMIREGKFSSIEIDETLRADNLDDLFNIIDNHYHNGYAYSKYDAKWWELINNEVLPYNEPVQINSSVSGIGDSIGDKIKQGGFYFLYKYIPDNELNNYPAIVAKKRAAQQQVNGWLDIDLFHTRATRENLIRSGIIVQTRMTPETYIKTTKEANVRGIGILTETLVIISTIIAIIIGLITIIRAIWPPKNSPTNDDIKNAAADVNSELFSPETDYSKTATSTSSLSGLALPLAIGAGALYFLFRKK